AGGGGGRAGPGAGGGGGAAATAAGAGGAAVGGATGAADACVATHSRWIGRRCTTVLSGRRSSAVRSVAPTKSLGGRIQVLPRSSTGTCQALAPTAPPGDRGMPGGRPP